MRKSAGANPPEMATNSWHIQVGRQLAMQAGTPLVTSLATPLARQLAMQMRIQLAIQLVIQLRWKSTPKYRSSFIFKKFFCH